MIWNNVPNEERLRLWKKVRDDINDYPVEQKLAAVAKFCSEMPFGSRTLDYYSPSDWPTPWEILFYGSFCTSSISLLMFYTLTLLSDPVRVELYLVEDEDVFLLPVIDNQFVLNWELGQVSKLSEIQGNFKVLKKYSPEQIKTIN